MLSAVIIVGAHPTKEEFFTVFVARLLMIEANSSGNGNKHKEKAKKEARKHSERIWKKRWRRWEHENNEEPVKMAMLMCAGEQNNTTVDGD